MIVGLNENGYVYVSYLGTDTSVQVINVHSDTKEVNYEQMDEELRNLQMIIKDFTTSK